MRTIQSRRESNLDADAVRRANDLLDANGVEFIYYSFVSVNGRVLTKVVPRNHLMRNLEKGVQFHSSAVSDLTTTVGGDLLGGGAEASEVTAMPDIATLVVLPWDPSMAMVFCELFVREDSPQDGGQASPLDVRGVLRNAHADFRDRTGLILKSGCEPEMSWIDSREPFTRPGLVPNYHLGTLEDNREIVKRVVTYAQAMGLDMVEGDYEDLYQIELNWMFDDAEKTADRLMLYRLVCRQVARELGIIASFMPKPFEGTMGNGCHHNVSLWSVAPDGSQRNVFVDPAIAEIHVTKEAEHAIGGLLTYSSDCMAVLAPTVNSYKRFADVGQFAPVNVDWGLDNKTCTVRVSASGRLEYKLPDASVNPYLSHSLVLAMMDAGLANRIEPGAPASEDSARGGGDAQFAPLARSLGEALSAMEASELVRSSLPPALLDLFISCKRDEWQRASAAVTDWDRRHYLEFLP